ncbi:MAG: chorismate-binding protein, partial [Bacteroidota bacterium]
MTLFQKVTEHFAKKLPFVVYCKPNSDVMIGVFQQNDSLHLITDFTENGFAFVSFDGNEKYYIPAEHSDVFVEKVASDVFYASKESTSVNNESEKQNFENLVTKGIKAIENKEFQKVVLSRKETMAMDFFDIEQILNSLHFNYSNAFHYCFYHPKIGMWIGATPEQFLQVENDKIKTVALAGTQLFSASLSWENKEQQEQQFVTDFIVESLNLYAQNTSVSEPYTF